MARRPSPWFWEARNAWMVTIDGVRHKLGEHTGPKPKKLKSGWNAPKSIMDAFHKLMATDKRQVASDSVAALLDDFQTWTMENRAPRTAQRYGDFLQSFITKCGLVPVGELSAQHVTEWLNEQKNWNSTTKRNAITALQRAFNWATKNWGLAANPIKGMEKPEAKRRTIVISDAEFEELLKHVSDQPFRDLLILSYDSGARPQEIKGLTAAHVQLDKQRAVLPADEAKGKIPRAIYFPTERSMKILKRLMKEHPEGPLLLNGRGKPWTGYAVKCRFEDLEEKVGRRLTHYALRHSFVTRKLIAGVDSHVVASLAGHKDVTMIHKVYSHIADDPQFMLDNAKKEKPRAPSRGKKR